MPTIGLPTNRNSVTVLNSPSEVRPEVVQNQVVVVPKTAVVSVVARDVSVSPTVERLEIVINTQEVTIQPVISNPTVSVNDETVAVVSAGLVAPPAGSVPVVPVTEELELVAGQAVAPFRVVYSDSTGAVLHDDPSRPSLATPVGISTTSTTASGQVVKVVVRGIVQIPGAVFDPNLPVFMGPSGTLVQMPPIVGRSVEVGTSIGQDQLVVNIKEPVFRA